MADEKLTLMELAIMDGVRQGMIERTDIGKHARSIVSDYQAPGPTLWTEATTRKFAEVLEGLIDKGYLTWNNYLLQVEAADKGTKFITDNTTELDSLPRVDDSKAWFKDQPPMMSL
ncbi:MAG: hypothetical protein JW790_02315 [Dehalococcoidales bacterium]|nr:hypothetical protein [Dehalococcoidales bacterium]